MIKTILKNSLIGTMVFNLSGCGEPPKPVIKQIEHIKPISITFHKKDLLTEEDIDLSNYSFSNQLLGKSYYGKYKYSGSYTYAGYPRKVYKGLKIKKHSENYELKYYQEDVYDKKGENLRTRKATFNIGYKVKANTISFMYPNSYQSIYLNKATQIESDMKRIFTSLDEIYIKKFYRLDGEKNSKYSAKSIYANFKRILGQYHYSKQERVSETKKENTFTLTINDKLIALYVEIYPYRDGSKVKYSTTIPYRINKDGSSLTKKEITLLKTRIDNIIND